MSTLADLSHHRWAIPVLAEIDRTSGSRFVTLARRLDVSGESLRRTLASLQKDGLVSRNPGYGHPLRPEYVLTRRGRTIAPRCAAVVEAARGQEAVVLKKWSLPVLALLGQPRRFSDLRTGLPEATPRALTLALKELQAAGLVDRRVTEEYPPSALYEATPAGSALATRAAALA